MNLEERISRRLRRTHGRQFVRDYAALSPAAHPEEPVGRGAMLERLLDALEPTFAGELPPSTYLWGPKGSGKTAVVRATVLQLAAVSRNQREGIHTTTRKQRPPTPPFVYVDAREASSEFALLASVLDGLVDRPAPTQGVSTADIRSRIDRQLDDRDGAVVAVDHLGEPRTMTAGAVAEVLTGFDAPVSWLGVGRTPPAESDAAPEITLQLGAYNRHALVDVVTDRTSRGLSRDALTHEQIREIATRADGDAHDALAGVVGGAVIAQRRGNTTIFPDDLDAGIEAVPSPCVALGRVLALPTNWTRVLAVLIDLDAGARDSVTEATRAIAATEGIELSESTVRRMLYELAEDGILERRPSDAGNGRGRPPSRLEPAFPTLVFRELFDESAD